MAAIGGIFNIAGGRVASETLAQMSKGMSRRGCGSRSAVILDRCGLFWGDRQFDSALSELGDIILLCDGEVYPDGGGTRSGFFGESDARLCAGIFGKYGRRSYEYLWGEYAIAAYDRQRGELVLLRDRSGGRPLYYAQSAGYFGFASEIKSIIAFLGEARVNRGALRGHILSRYGQYSGEDIYCHINDVGAGAGIAVTGLGAARFDFRESSDEKETYGQSFSGTVSGEFVCPDEVGMRRMLCEILYAFDYPQFDCLMPTFLRDCERAAQEEKCITDGALFFDLKYASERYDRLSTMVGYRPRRTVPDKYIPKERELKKMESALRSLLSESDRDKLEYIFETDIVEEIMKIENTARRVRCLGMVIQSEIWYDGYRICLR